MNTKTKIKLFILDVDGVLTDGKIIYDHHGNISKAFHSHDGYGMRRLMENGVDIAIISGNQAPCVEHRMTQLGIQRVYQGIQDKPLCFREIKKQLNINNDQIAYMGDDVPDQDIMQQVGLAIAPTNAHQAILAISDFITHQKGGEGAAREACDFILNLNQTSPMVPTQAPAL